MKGKKVRLKRQNSLVKIRKRAGSSKKYEVFLVRSRRNISAFLYDLTSKKCILGFTSAAKDFIDTCKTKSINRSSVEGAKLLGSKFREKISLQIKDFDNNTYFNRSIYKYHGRIRGFCEEFFVS